MALVSPLSTTLAGLVMIRIVVGSGLLQAANPETDHDHLHLAELIEKGSDVDLLREMIFVIISLMAPDMGSLIGAAYGNAPSTERTSLARLSTERLETPYTLFEWRRSASCRRSLRVAGYGIAATASCSLGAK